MGILGSLGLVGYYLWGPVNVVARSFWAGISIIALLLLLQLKPLPFLLLLLKPKLLLTILLLLELKSVLMLLLVLGETVVLRGGVCAV